LAQIMLTPLSDPSVKGTVCKASRKSGYRNKLLRLHARVDNSIPGQCWNFGPKISMSAAPAQTEIHYIPIEEFLTKE
jgi:hypothetical protein